MPNKIKNQQGYHTKEARAEAKSSIEKYRPIGQKILNTYKRVRVDARTVILQKK